MEVRFPSLQHVETAEVNIERCYDHLISVSIEVLDWYPRGVATVADRNQIYVATDKRIFIFSENGEYLDMFSHAYMVNLLNIAIHKDIIYVTDLGWPTIFKFRMDDFCLVSMMGRIEGAKKQFWLPQGLAVSNIGNVFVSDRSNSRVRILDSDLNYKQDISHHSMTRPVDVKLTTEEIFVLSAPFRDPSLIHVFTHSGYKLRSISLQNPHASTPSSFCLGPNGDFITCDSITYHVNIYSKEGELICTIGEDGQEMGKLLVPYGIALTDNLKLVVLSCYRICGLQIFSCF